MQDQTILNQKLQYFPENIRKIGIVAPASHTPKEMVSPVIESLSTMGVEVHYSPSIFAQTSLPYLAGDDISRLDDLHLTLDANVDMIWCVRGGYGSMRLLSQINWEKFDQHILMGFSDITALLLAMYTRKSGTPIAGIHVGRFPTEATHQETQNSMRWALSRKGQFNLPLKTHHVYQTGEATGKILPVNLSIFQSLIGTPYMPNLKNHILLIEDVGEPLRKIDRFLAHLECAGILSEINGLLLGYFTDLDHPELFSEVISHYAKKVKGPVVSGVMFGHESPNCCIPLGAQCYVNAIGSNPQIILKI